jgi:hypothetical protein
VRPPRSAPSALSAVAFRGFFLFALTALAGAPGCRRGRDQNAGFPAPLSPASSEMPGSGYSVVWEEHELPARVPRGSTVRARVVFRNSGDQVWPASVKLSYRWGPVGSASPVAHAENRTLLRRPIAPGERVILDRVEVRTPQVSGRYVLTLELVNELVSWFSDRGGAVLSVPVSVD